jgi:hypothetical protein
VSIALGEAITKGLPAEVEHLRQRLPLDLSSGLCREIPGRRLAETAFTQLGTPLGPFGCKPWSLGVRDAWFMPYTVRSEIPGAMGLR